MRLAVLFTLLAGIPPGAAHAQTLPPIQSPEQAVQQLSLEPEPSRLVAIANVATACRGRLRHALRDHPAVIGAVARLLRQGSTPVRRAALDLVRCFAAARTPALLGPSLSDADPKVAIYAAEIAAQVPEPAVTELLLDRLEAVQADCSEPKAEAMLVERCVWFVYSAGATIGPGHDQKLRDRVKRLVEPQLGSPHPKVREVAAESLARARPERVPKKR